MPNHITNILRISGSQELLAKVAESVKGQDSPFDFNRLIPKPAELDITSGSVSSNARALFDDNAASQMILFYPWAKKFETVAALRDYLRKEYKPNDGDPATLDEFAARIQSNLEKYGAETWYEWCPKNWGTKWNAYSCIGGMAGRDLIYHFETAWAPPEPVINKLAEMFPEVRICLIWCDEGDDDQHREYWEDGKKQAD